jgi:tetratricopeptide (TPR) repeat protein
MARFDKLEFDEPQQPDEPARESGPRRGEEVDWLHRADQHRRTGFYENALKFYSRALEHDKSLVAGWLGQVQMLVLLEEYPEAELWARKALELFPSHGDLLAGRAQALCRMQDIRQAHECCDGALKQSGQSAYRWIARGELMLAGKQPTDQYCFDKAQQLEGDWLVAAEIALIYLHYRNPSRALPRARRACETAPDQYYPWLVQARCQRELGFSVPARESLQHCLSLCPGHVEALEMLDATRGSISSLGRWLRGLWRR